MEFEGKIIAIDEVSFKKKDWEQMHKTQYTIEELSWQYPSSVTLDAFWKAKENLDGKFKVWDFVVAHINAKSREYNGKRFNSLNVWRMENVWGEKLSIEEDNNDDDLPF